MGLIMVIAMAFMLGVGGGHVHMMGHVSHSPAGVVVPLQPEAADGGTKPSTIEEVPLGIHKHAEPNN